MKIKTIKTFQSLSLALKKFLELRRMLNLTQEVKATVFKTLEMSKIVHLELITNIPTSTKTELNKVQKESI